MNIKCPFENDYFLSKWRVFPSVQKERHIKGKLGKVLLAVNLTRIQLANKGFSHFLCVLLNTAKWQLMNLLFLTGF